MVMCEPGPNGLEFETYDNSCLHILLVMVVSRSPERARSDEEVLSVEGDIRTDKEFRTLGVGLVEIRERNLMLLRRLPDGDAVRRWQRAEGEGARSLRSGK